MRIALPSVPTVVLPRGLRAAMQSLWMLSVLLAFTGSANAQSSSASPSVDPAFAAALWMSSEAVASTPDVKPKAVLNAHGVKRGSRVLGAGLGFLTGAGFGLAGFGHQVDPCDFGHPSTPKATLLAGGVTMAVGALMTTIGAYRMSQRTPMQRNVIRGSPGERAKSGLIGALTGVLGFGVVGAFGFFESACFGS